MKQLFDPKLREAAEEVKALCHKYDCAAMVLLVSPTHAEFVNHVGPTWSVARLERPNELRFRSKREDFASKEEQDRCTEATVHMLTSTIEWSRQLNDMMRQIVAQLGQHMKIGWSTWKEPDSIPE